MSDAQTVAGFVKKQVRKRVATTRGAAWSQVDDVPSASVKPHPLRSELIDTVHTFAPSVPTDRAGEPLQAFHFPTAPASQLGLGPLAQV